MLSRKLLGKAARLVSDGAVREVPATVYRVTGHYIVALPDEGGWATCSCPSVNPCSHIVSARAQRDGVSVEVVDEQLRAAAERELERRAARRRQAVVA